ncbi:DUF3307 domain-containing protein [Flavobacterium kingsejongi]|uniref:DUF3307 domain-containing protein n=1 Tax=Flavobacterium kingsejongi TaxID=1678728 RepID=A0A2S1LPR7_9FLAO|nr:DUF3307 domain-containing protein [Flavobacterium kingsejongi]AWG25745.1 hypothetical protein FK004_11205 [Flavobacterium kingsejongi]
MILFIKLFLAHLLGDFLLQPNSWVADKERNKGKSLYLYLHCLLHGALAWLFVFELDFGPYALLLAVVHGIIDWAKLEYQNPQNKRRWFLVDQALHLAVIIGITFLWNHDYFELEPLMQNQFWIISTAGLFLTNPSSILIKNIISIWTPENNTDDYSLQNTGNYIGILERLFVLCFILTGHFEATGFLLGAKSIFRFGDLRMARDRKLTEYVLIGTLISFGVAIGTALLCQFFLNNLAVNLLD